MVIVNATIFPVETPVIEDGFLRISGGKITQIGPMSQYEDLEDEVLDAKGLFVFPGLVDAHCHIGMWEDGIDFEGDDGNEDTDPVTPHLRAIDAINPMDRTFREAYQAGVTTVVTGPGSANPIAGQFAALKTFGNRVDDMVISPYCAMKMSLGENPKSVYHGKHEAPVTRMATAALIREALMKTIRYDEDLKRYQEDPQEREKPEFDLKLESLLPVIHRQVPVKFHAHRADDIYTALRIAKEFDLWVTIEHCTEGHLIVEQLKEEGVCVAVGPMICDRSKPELKNLSTKNAGLLSQAGIPVSIITDHPEVPVHYLSLSALIAVKEGMAWEKTLESVTLNPARHCGIDHRVGSLKAGKDADILICDGNLILNPFAKILYCFIDGKVVWKA